MSMYEWNRVLRDARRTARESMWRVPVGGNDPCAQPAFWRHYRLFIPHLK